MYFFPLKCCCTVRTIKNPVGKMKFLRLSTAVSPTFLPSHPRKKAVIPAVRDWQEADSQSDPWTLHRSIMVRKGNRLNAPRSHPPLVPVMFEMLEWCSLSVPIWTKLIFPWWVWGQNIINMHGNWLSLYFEWYQEGTAKIMLWMQLHIVGQCLRLATHYRLVYMHTHTHKRMNR